MAKSKSSTKPKPPIKSTSDLAKDTANPRKMTAKAATGLSKSLDRFGDLSGIVFNERTGKLVAGHQRMTQIEARWGKQEIVLIDEQANLHGIRIDDEHFFPVRVVNWSKAKQRAANVAANNQRLAGEFTDDLASYLLEVENELTDEMPNVLEDLLIEDLLDQGDGGNEMGLGTEDDYSMRFQVVVEFDDEDNQVDLLKRLKEEGFKCRALVS